ncbi:MAG TPA: hypothetical protein VFE05_24400 [Longimicrobiaceae bacterium]|jgi:hypothetical protein|nr:hypothetical protein [Longimicrobiaceae bacterium]
MRKLLRYASHILVAAATLGIAGCSDSPADPIAPKQGPAHRLTSGGYELLSSNTNLSVSSGVTYSVQIPSSGPVYLSFDGRINYPYGTAGNGSVLNVKVNGVAIAANTLTKGTSYYYPNSNRTENWYDNRGAGYSLWGLFWSPDFTSNNNSSDNYYVSGGGAYSYTFDISNYVNLGQTNSVALTNEGGWTGVSPQVVLNSISLRNY